MDNSTTVSSLKALTGRYLARRSILPESLVKFSSEHKEYLTSMIKNDIDLFYDDTKTIDRMLPRLTQSCSFTGPIILESLDLAWLDDTTLAYVKSEDGSLHNKTAQAKDLECSIWDLQTGAQYIYPLDIKKLKVRKVTCAADEEYFKIKFVGDDQFIAVYDKRSILQWLSRNFNVSAEKAVKYIVPSGDNPWVIWDEPLPGYDHNYMMAQFPLGISQDLGVQCDFFASFNNGGDINNFFLSYLNKVLRNTYEFSTSRPQLIKKTKFGTDFVSKNGSLIASQDMPEQQIVVIPNLRADIPEMFMDQLLAADNKKAALAKIIFKSQNIDIDKLNATQNAQNLGKNSGQ